MRTRLAKAQAAVTALNEQGRGKQRVTERAALQAGRGGDPDPVPGAGPVAVPYTECVHTRRLRRSGSQPTTGQVKRDLRVKDRGDRLGVATAIGRLGWRGYATHAPSDQRSRAQAVLAYRSQYLVETDFGRLKGHPLSVTPLYLERDDHATGLIRLLSVGLRVLTLLEFVVRQRLAVT